MKITKSNARNLGILFSIILFIIALYPSLNEENIKIPTLILSIILFLLSLIFPKILIPFTIIWIKLGLLLGKIFSPIILVVIFFLVVWPTSLILKIFNNDPLNQKFNNSLKSYWIKNKLNVSKMKDQF